MAAANAAAVSSAAAASTRWAPPSAVLLGPITPTVATGTRATVVPAAGSVNARDASPATAAHASALHSTCISTSSGARRSAAAAARAAPSPSMLQRSDPAATASTRPRSTWSRRRGESQSRARDPPLRKRTASAHGSAPAQSGACTLRSTLSMDANGPACGHCAPSVPCGDGRGRRLRDHNRAAQPHIAARCPALPYIGARRAGSPLAQYRTVKLCRGLSPARAHLGAGNA